MSKGVSILDKNISISGNIFSESDLDVSGNISGTIVVNSFSVKENGNINGEIYANEVIVTKDAKIDGRIFSKKIKLLKGAYVKGDLKYSILSIEDGAKIEGQCSFMEETEIENLILSAKNSMFEAQ